MRCSSEPKAEARILHEKGGIAVKRSGNWHPCKLSLSEPTFQDALFGSSGLRCSGFSAPQRYQAGEAWLFLLSLAIGPRLSASACFWANFDRMVWQLHLHTAISLVLRVDQFTKYFWRPDHRPSAGASFGRITSARMRCGRLSFNVGNTGACSEHGLSQRQGISVGMPLFLLVWMQWQIKRVRYSILGRTSET